MLKDKRYWVDSCKFKSLLKKGRKWGTVVKSPPSAARLPSSRPAPALTASAARLRAPVTALCPICKMRWRQYPPHRITVRTKLAVGKALRMVPITQWLDCSIRCLHSFLLFVQPGLILGKIKFTEIVYAKFKSFNYHLDSKCMLLCYFGI